MTPHNVVRLASKSGRPNWGPKVRDQRRRCAMSAVDKAKNKAEELTGKAKEKIGQATDDRDLEAEGHKDQTKGNVKNAGEKVKDAFKH